MATKAVTPLQCPRCSASYDNHLAEAVVASFCPKCRFPLMLIAGKYRLERLINQGGFGMLYLARHIGLELFNERVIKVLRPELFQTPGVLERFRREVQLTANLSEQNNHIVRIYDDFGEESQLGHYYVMEYLRGLTLSAIQELPQSLPYDLSFHIFYQLCKAMGAAHRAGVIHRDLKPDNLFLIQRDTDPHFVKVIDFGLARPEVSGEASLTHQQVMGTPSYMSPEQCVNNPIDTRSDIYAMGIIFYQMLSGRHPFPIDSTDTMALFFAHMSKEPTSLGEYMPELPSKLVAAIMKSLEKSPQNRHATAEEFWDALAPFAPADTTYPSLLVTGPSRLQSRPGLFQRNQPPVHDSIAFQATAANLQAVPDPPSSNDPTFIAPLEQAPDSGTHSPLQQNTHKEMAFAPTIGAPTIAENANTPKQNTPVGNKIPTEAEIIPESFMTPDEFDDQTAIVGIPVDPDDETGTPTATPSLIVEEDTDDEDVHEGNETVVSHFEPPDEELDDEPQTESAGVFQEFLDDSIDILDDKTSVLPSSESKSASASDADSPFSGENARTHRDPVSPSGENAQVSEKKNDAPVSPEIQAVTPELLAGTSSQDMLEHLETVEFSDVSEEVLSALAEQTSTKPEILDANAATSPAVSAPPAVAKPREQRMPVSRPIPVSVPKPKPEPPVATPKPPPVAVDIPNVAPTPIEPKEPSLPIAAKNTGRIQFSHVRPVPAAPEITTPARGISGAWIGGLFVLLLLAIGLWWMVLR